MAILEAIGEVTIRILIEVIPAKIVRWVTGKDTGFISGYRTEQKKPINFTLAKKFLLTWEDDIAHLKSNIAEGLETMNEQLDVDTFQFKPIDKRIVVEPPTLISFYAFHFLLQWLAGNKIKTIGVVESAGTTYTTYDDPDSENVIGETDRGDKFFITLMEDYSDIQFLRINRDIETIKGYDVLSIKNSLVRSGQNHD